MHKHEATEAKEIVVVLKQESRRFPGWRWREAIRHFLELAWRDNHMPGPSIQFNVESDTFILDLGMNEDANKALYHVAWFGDDAPLMPPPQDFRSVVHAMSPRAEVECALARFLRNEVIRTVTIGGTSGVIALQKGKPRASLHVGKAMHWVQDMRGFEPVRVYPRHGWVVDK